MLLYHRNTYLLNIILVYIHNHTLFPSLKSVFFWRFITKSYDSAVDWSTYQRSHVHQLLPATGLAHSGAVEQTRSGENASFFCDWSQLISKTIKYSHQIQLVIFSQSENSLPDLRAAAIIGFGKQHDLDLCEQKRYFMLVNDGLRLIKWCSVKLHVVMFLHMCSFWYKRPIYPLNYILKIPGIFSDTRTFYYVYGMGFFFL